MHKNLKLIFLSAVILSFCGTLSAQENMSAVNRTLTKEAYDSTVGKAREKTETRKYRMKRTGENDAPTAEDKRLLLVESVPPDRSRSVFDFYENGVLRRYEEIRVGNKTYVKYDSENWRRKTEQVIYRAYGESGERKTEYLFVGQEKVNNQTGNLYRMTEVLSYPNLPNSKPVTKTEKYWINADGLLVKYSFSTTDSALRTLLNVTKDYEYDPNIKIAAPPISTPRPKKVRRKK